MDNKRPILVTGAPRSGTTWVGRTLAEAPRVRYIHEPFNISAPSCRCGLKLDYWFHYAGPEDTALRQHISHLLASPIHPVNIRNVADALLNPQRRKEGLRKVKSAARSLTANRSLIKDPLALFSAEWMAKEFAMEVIVLIRHPAAFVASYKALNWSHPFTHFLRQPQLVHDCLASFISDIEQFSMESPDVIDQASLLWNLIHFQIHQYQLRQPDWTFVNYDELAQDPMSGFADIFQHVGLPFTWAVQAKIVESSSAGVKGQGPDDPYGIHRNSSATMGRWRQMLTTAEIARIKDNVGEIWPLFFTDAAWCD